ncbi:hypothetical protein SXCC_03488 [Gluconacetobacter sp. SXCC-1]|nr:hypothetical protein SXCC_03488 [Gluconacetobacter sp. SXCC-1]
MREPEKNRTPIKPSAGPAGRPTTKIHVIVDATGKAVAVSLTPEQRADIAEPELLQEEDAPKVFIAEKRLVPGFDGVD